MAGKALPRHSTRDHPASVPVGQRSVLVERIGGVSMRSCWHLLLGPGEGGAIAPQAQHVGGSLLTAQWADPDFDINQCAFYYVRVIKIPKLRWKNACLL